MTDLIDRLSGQDPTRAKISVSQFTAGMRAYARGVITAQQIAQDWDLQGAELTQAQALRVQIDAQSNATTKITYVLLVEAVATLIEITDDTIYHNPNLTVNKQKVAADLGIVL